MTVEKMIKRWFFILYFFDAPCVFLFLSIYLKFFFACALNFSSFYHVVSSLELFSMAWMVWQIKKAIFCSYCSYTLSSLLFLWFSKHINIYLKNFVFFLIEFFSLSIFLLIQNILEIFIVKNNILMSLNEAKEAYNSYIQKGHYRQ